MHEILVDSEEFGNFVLLKKEDTDWKLKFFSLIALTL